MDEIKASIKSRILSLFDSALCGGKSHTRQGNSDVLHLPVLTWHLFKCIFSVWCLSVKTNLLESYRAVFRVHRHESCLREARTWEFCSSAIFLIVEV